MSKTNKPISPLMQQFFSIKKEHADTLLLFQVGDFYELFFDDAKVAAEFLGITLTKRGTFQEEPIPLCGVPIHAIDHYLTKLVRGGFKVALCDQLEPAQTGKLVARGVTRVLTPATLTDEKLLDARSASYLFSFFPLPNAWGLLFGELLTAQLSATVLPVGSEKMLESELTRFFPDEIIVPDSQAGKPFASYFKKLGYFITKVDAPDQYQDDENYNQWRSAFSPNSHAILDKHDVIDHSLQTFYAYIRKTNAQAVDQFRSISWYDPHNFLLLDGATQRNLELIKNNQDNSRAHTLFSVMDRAVTPMGSRMIKKWIVRPLLNKSAIEKRQDSVVECLNNVVLVQQLKEKISLIGDIERLVGRIALYRATHNDYCALARVLCVLPEVSELLQGYSPESLLAVIARTINNFDQLQQLLSCSLDDDTSNEWIIKKGFNSELDRVRDLIERGQYMIIDLERKEQKETGINSLKIRYNQSHGYYIEVTKANLHAVPDYYTRRQTLVGRERFITDELQTLQYDIERARTQIETLERDLFDQVKREVALSVAQLRKSAYALAHLDALVGFARTAYDNNYVRPTFTHDRDIVIENGRHPVVEQSVGSHFIANNTNLMDDESLLIITGPNMGGKSTYLRQVALISIMAQCGSLVPAQSASLPLIDRIFTRIGAGDNVAEGKSTFLVEMEETATICMQATKNSLVILDEVGRGTSTFDGLAIAQAVVEYIYTRIGARCLFATHYHELTALEKDFSGIASYYLSSKKTASGIVFLHKIIKGVADGSFGIEVARLADLPESIIDRAQVIVSGLSDLSVSGIVPARQISQCYDKKTNGTSTSSTTVDKSIQLQKIIDQQNSTLTVLKEIDYDNLSPKKAFDILWQLQGE